MNLRDLFGRRKRPAAAEQITPPRGEPDAPAAEASGAVRGAPATEPGASAGGHPSGRAAVGAEEVVAVLRTVYDPEIPVNIYEMGLIYGIDIQPPGNVVIRMTLTSPGCPVAASLPIEVENRVLALPGVTSVYVDLVWDPPWTPERMSEAARLQLGML